MQASAEIARDNPESFFVTAFAAILDARSGMLEFCNAGHEPYLCRPGRTPERPSTRAGRRVVEGFAYASARCTLAAGESLCVLTDGVTEAMDRTAFYGRARLTRCSRMWRTRKPLRGCATTCAALSTVPSRPTT